MKKVSLVAIGAIVALGVSCNTTPMSPTAPTATEHGVSAANADGSTLKVTAPGLVTPFDSERIDGRRPIMIWQNARGLNSQVGLAYELEVWDDEKMIYTMIVGETPGTGTHVYPADLAYDTAYSWRIRAALETARGPWSDWGNFRTMTAPVATTPTLGPGDGTIGPPRSIGLNEAYSIIVAIHNGGRFDLGSRSTRDYRVNFIFGAVAAIHYGHARYNPQGPDTDWCVKDAGGGRPPSDDVLVSCSTRDAWDLIAGAGGNGYRFHLDYIGKLPSSQNVYEPGRSSLGFIGQ
jgi:hypothetical protein